MTNNTSLEIPLQDISLPVMNVCKGSSGGACSGSCGGTNLHCSPISKDKTPNTSDANDGSPLVFKPQERVLSTMEADGSRRWLRPKLSLGKYWHRRRIVAYLLVAFFVSLPHLRMYGKPVVLFDIPARKFTILGHTFLPTDTPLLALGIIGVFLAIALATSLSGRLWCGWGCPQTVYMEYFFRPIDRFFEGTKGKGGKPNKAMSAFSHVTRLAVYLLLSMVLAHTALAYFVGTDRLAMWLHSSPAQHPFAFMLMAGTTLALLYNFMFFREQMCLIACPYGRLQSVMLDRQSLIVGYDSGRGEPRGKARKVATLEALGDCIDCKKCVVTCPTGIDIRNGLQMECINCTQCIDACNDVMTKLDRPIGLIRYTSQDELAGKRRRIVRARPVLYALFLTIVSIAFVGVLSTKYSFDARLLRAGGNPFSHGPTGELRNSMRIRLVNRSNESQIYSIQATVPAGLRVDVLDQEKLNLKAGETTIVPVLITASRETATGYANSPAELLIQDNSGNQRTLKYRFLGPSN